ncbi:MAG: cytochrome c biogenesis protein ResB [Candidatus Omnitrophica bacterium]|jgi:cytochrome c biogenesis protein ResB|nr:cytochrome c biogenesis protein ResB [Candidatus Omnitrophota bacterium]MDD5079621.1 cytochrome c biogenesis protein ResB [Candidatus Omnitrophota bacterium]
MCLSGLKENKIVKFLGSIKLAFILFCCLILACLYGALVPEELRPEVYYSWWFLSLLFLFAGNLLICGLSRFARSFNKLGSTLTHAAVLVILAGSLYSYLFAVRGTIEFTEGQGIDSFVSNKGEQSLGFEVVLDDFNLAWYAPYNYKVKFFVQDKGIKGVALVKQHKPYAIKGSGYLFTVLEYFPDFKMGEDGVPRNNSEQPDNPAVLIEIKGLGGIEQRWLFARHPEISMSSDKNIKFLFSIAPAIREFSSRVRFIDGSQQAQRVIKVNSPCEFKGYTFYQSGYDAGRLDWTALDVVKDPGVFWVFIGFILLNFGIIINYLQKIKPVKDGGKGAACR